MHREHEAELEAMEQKRFTNPAYEGVLTAGQFVFEENELAANGGYSRLNSRMGSTQRKPQLRFVETESSTPHYSTLNLNNGSTVIIDSDQAQVQNPKNHQYEDVDPDSEAKIISGDRQGHVNREHTNNDFYEDVSIGKLPKQDTNYSTESCEGKGSKQSQVELDTEVEKNKGGLENQELDMEGAMQAKGWNGMHNYSDHLELNPRTDND